MKKRFIAGILVTALALTLSACVVPVPQKTNTTEKTEEVQDDSDSDADAEKNTEEKKDEEKKKEKKKKAKPTEKPIKYKKIKVDKLEKDLAENAMNASNKYMDKYLEVTGKLANIDSSGDYININPVSDDLVFVYTMQCYIKDNKQLKKVSKMKVNDKITLKVQITDVGEIMKYSADIIEIE